MGAAAVVDRLQARVQAWIRHPQLRTLAHRLEARTASRARLHSRAAAAAAEAAALLQTTRLTAMVPKILTKTTTMMSRVRRVADDVAGDEGEIAAAARTTSGWFAK